MSRIFLKTTVVEEAYKRMERLFDEFDTIVVNFSGGKDSTVVLNIALDVARRRGRLPLPVFFIDQEAEWQHTIDYVKRVMYSKEVKPYWLQIEFKLFNSASQFDYWLVCWDKKKEHEWIRKKDPISIKENTFGAERFNEVFEKSIPQLFKGKTVAQVGGVRAEESPARLMGMTMGLTYKDITWGRQNKTGYTFYPIYDWSYTDVWKFIFERKLDYNQVYNKMFALGVPIKDMRVSSLSHETALRSAALVQEIEPDTWVKLQKRLKGMNTIKHLGYKIDIKELPKGFKDWEEYRNFLIAKLIPEKEQLHWIEKALKMDKKYKIIAEESGYWGVWIHSILISDKYFTKLSNFEKRKDIIAYRRYLAKGEFARVEEDNKLVYAYINKMKEKGNELKRGN